MDKVAWVYISPESIEQEIAWIESSAAMLRMALDSVRSGGTVMLGDGPNVQLADGRIVAGGVCYFTAPSARSDPFTER